MNFRDQWATNSDGQNFIFTIEMQRQLHQAGLPITPQALAQLPASRPASPKPAPSAPKPNTPSSASSDESAPSSTSSQPAHPPTAEFSEPETIQIDPLTGKYLGRVKWYNATKGYGFIARGDGEELFFHKSDVLALAEDLVPGRWILYDVEETEKGLEANEIELYDERLL
jgi:cold shock protein